MKENDNCCIYKLEVIVSCHLGDIIHSERKNAVWERYGIIGINIVYDKSPNGAFDALVCNE